MSILVLKVNVHGKQEQLRVPVPIQSSDARNLSSESGFAESVYACNV